MSFSHAQATVNSFVAAGGATTLSCTLSSAPSVGDVVCVEINTFSNIGATITVSSVKDGNGNTYTISPSSPSATNPTTSGNQWMAYYIVPPGASTSATVTATFSALNSAADEVAMMVDDFSVVGTAVFDQDAAGSGSSGLTINTPSVTPTVPGELFYGACVPEHSVTVINSPWTGTIEASNSSASAYILSQSSAQAINWTQSLSGHWDSMLMAFISAAPDEGLPFINSNWPVEPVITVY